MSFRILAKCLDPPRGRLGALAVAAAPPSGTSRRLCPDLRSPASQMSTGAFGGASPAVLGDRLGPDGRLWKGSRPCTRDLRSEATTSAGGATEPSKVAEAPDDEVDHEGGDLAQVEGTVAESGRKQGGTVEAWMTKRALDPKDRSREIPLETSIAYMKSAAYRNTYGDSKVWELYRRNFAKGNTRAPPRKSCIGLDRKLKTGNPCPICRDEYLVVDHRNADLLRQFIADYSGKVLHWSKTQVCKDQHLNILVAIERARDLGLLDVDTEFVEYDYSKYRQ